MCVCVNLSYLHVRLVCVCEYTNVDGSSSAPACLPVWHADVAHASSCVGLPAAAAFAAAFAAALCRKEPSWARGGGSAAACNP